MAKITVTFSLDSERDKRILRWLEGLPKRKKSEAIREVLAAHLGQNGITLQDIYEAVMDLKRSGLAVASQDDSRPQSDVPADVLDNLNKLGL
jgi:hypothetical protein